MKLLIVILSRGLTCPYGHAFTKCQIQALSHPERFPTALLHEDQQYIAKSSSWFGSCIWCHLSCFLYFLYFFGHGFILFFSKYSLSTGFLCILFLGFFSAFYFCFYFMFSETGLFSLLLSLQKK